MAAHPGFKVFVGKLTEWEDYVERLENYFVAHDIKTETKREQYYSANVAWQLTS